MVAIHIIDSGHPSYAEQLAAPRAAEGVSPIEDKHVPGNLLESSSRAFHLSSPYISWVDEDDAILTLDWLAEAASWFDQDPTVVAVYPRWRMTENGLTRPETSGEPISASCYLASPGLILFRHLTVMRRPNVEAILADVWAAPVMAKSHERLLTIGSLATVGSSRIPRSRTSGGCGLAPLGLSSLPLKPRPTREPTTSRPREHYLVTNACICASVNSGVFDAQNTRWWLWFTTCQL